MQLNIKQLILEGYSYDEILMESLYYHPDRKFIRRGLEATNKTSPTSLAVGLAAPLGGAVIGGAIGNNIHGDDGTIGGVVYDEQAHNDDEYDGTGALLGLAGGTLLTKQILSPKYKSVQKRAKKRNEIYPVPSKDLKTEATINKAINSLTAAQELGNKLFKRK